ncbi:Ferric reductase like transmembrane component domain containing protein [Naviculisporaceae sp. PSN 640]
MKAFISVLSLLFLAVGGSAQHGIIGFGISMYPDLCCQACHDSLAHLYLSCTTFEDPSGHGGMGGMVKRDDEGAGKIMLMGMTSDECRASNKAWLETMAYCIQQNCNADGYPADKQAECFSSQATGGGTEPKFHESLPDHPPTQELAPEAMWLNETSLVNSDMYYSTHGTLAEFVRSEEYHSKYGVSLIFIFVGSCLVLGILTQIRSRSQPKTGNKPASKLKQHLLLPALTPSSRRLEPLPSKIGYIPSRALSVAISLYVVLNVIFSAVSIRSFQPNTWFLSAGFELCEYVGNRTGTLSLVNMALAILLSGRNNILIALTGWSQTTFLTLHRWIARISVVQVVVHSIAYTAAYFQEGYGGVSAYAEKAAEPFYTWGIVGTVLLCLVVGLAILPIRAKVYEFFLASHIVLVVLSLVATWYHLVPHYGHQFGYEVWLYIAFAFWGWDRLVRLARIAAYNGIGGVGMKAVVEAVPGTDGKIMEITVFPRVCWGLGHAGQHSFLSFPGLFVKTRGRVWENHPFSIAGWTNMPGQSASLAKTATRQQVQDKKAVTEATHTATTTVHTGKGNDRSIKFLIRAHAGITSHLRQQVLASPSANRLETTIYTEGPYAGHRATTYPLYQADTIVCFAGGIGITHILGFVQEYLTARARATAARKGGMKATRFILAWSARELALIQHVKKRFLGADSEERTRSDLGLELMIWCTADATSSEVSGGDEGKREGAMEIAESSDIWNGRMNIASVLRGAMEVGHRAAVMVCAPGAMADEVTRQTIKCLSDGFQVDLIEEAFAW